MSYVCTGYVQIFTAIYVQVMYKYIHYLQFVHITQASYSVNSFKVWYFSKASKAYCAREDISSRDLPSALVATNSMMLGYSLSPMLRAVETINMMMMAPSPNLKALFASSPDCDSRGGLKYNSRVSKSSSQSPSVVFLLTQCSCCSTRSRWLWPRAPHWSRWRRAGLACLPAGRRGDT